MMVRHCNYCNDVVDTDCDVDHFNEKGLCSKECDALIVNLTNIICDINAGDLILSSNYKDEVIDKL